MKRSLDYEDHTWRHLGQSLVEDQTFEISGCESKIQNSTINRFASPLSHHPSLFPHLLGLAFLTRRRFTLLSTSCIFRHNDVKITLTLLNSPGNQGLATNEEEKGSHRPCIERLRREREERAQHYTAGFRLFGIPSARRLARASWLVSLVLLPSKHSNCCLFHHPSFFISSCRCIARKGLGATVQR